MIDDQGLGRMITNVHIQKIKQSIGNAEINFKSVRADTSV